MASEFEMTELMALRNPVTSPGSNSHSAGSISFMPSRFPATHGCPAAEGFQHDERHAFVARELPDAECGVKSGKIIAPLRKCACRNAKLCGELSQKFPILPIAAKGRMGDTERWRRGCDGFEQELLLLLFAFKPTGDADDHRIVREF
ncbi:MAG: hypothetical protein R3F19_18575 [Verrucomicrobiales bacterium]